MVIKKMIYLERGQEQLLKRLAVEGGASETEVMRRALNLYARERLTDPLVDLIGAFRGGPKDAARSHDRYVVKQRRGK